MKACFCNLAAALWLLVGIPTSAAVHYVDVNSASPVSPFSTWATAATNIQDAVDVATPGDEVLVTNGVYQYGGHKAIGADVTNRVMMLNAVTVQSVNGPAATIIQGYQPVGASNANNAVRCALLGNGSMLAGFTLTGGQAGTGNYISGGGVVGTVGAQASVVLNCVITGNMATNGIGGGALDATLVNCLLANNQAHSGGGCAQSTLVNCTVVSNTALMYGGGVYQCTSENSIVYFNTAGVAGSNYFTGTLAYCCTSPLPGGAGNITNAPGFVNFAAGNFHLQIGSPCIDAGSNGYVTALTDLDGNPRIVDGTVDMGAYESQFTGTIHYVSLTSTNPVAPYTAWSTAATNIQDAISAAQPGEYVVAADGNYDVGGTVVRGVESNRVAITNPVTVLGLSGPQGATITGGTQMRCAYVGTNAVLSGFTLTGGKAALGGNVTNDESGGGAWCEASGIVSNCVLSGNTVVYGYGYGGGDYGGTVVGGVVSNNSASYGGGVYQAVVTNCLIISNRAYIGGGGAYLSKLYNSTLSSNATSDVGGGADTCVSYNCTFTGNQAGSGGGTENGTNFNCTFSGNTGSYGGGTAYSTNYDCLLTGNTASINGGGAYSGSLFNCIVEGNTATNTGGLGGGAYLANAVNCTIISNMAANSGGGINGGNVYNSIIYYNSASTGSNWYGNNPAYCCTVPPGSQAGNFYDFTNPPVFVNLAAGDLHQQASSPTINGGDGFYLTGYPNILPPLLADDFDGNPRIVGGYVDVGAYEYQGSNLGLPIPIPWLMQYHLPTDGSADYVDSDGSGMNNWEEWFAGVTPNNPSTYLRMLAPVPSGTNLVVTWQSVINHTYYLQRATGLAVPSVFQPLASNIVAHAGTTSYTDPNAPAPGPYFYRIGVNSQ
jgi:hypothetical protein